jgi:hypothetical protein
LRRRYGGDRYLKLDLGIAAIAMPSLILFYFKYENKLENLTTARTIGLICLVIGLIFYNIGMSKSPFLKNYRLIGAISIVLISLFLLIKFDPNLTIIGGWQWLTAILAATSAIWIQQFEKI